MSASASFWAWKSAAAELSTYCTDVYNMTVTTMENIPENERVRMAYLLGDNGLNAIAKTSFQAAVVDMVADNVVVVDDVSGKATAMRSARADRAVEP